MEPIVTNDENQNFSDRLNDALDRIGVPPKGKGRQSAVAKMFNVSQKGSRKWLEGEAIPKATKHPEFIAAFNSLKITGEWLFYGNPDYAPDWLPNSKNKKYPNQSYTDIIAAPEVKGKVPLYSLAQVGDWSEADIKLLPTDGYEMVETRIEVKERTFAVKVAGDSMEAEFSSNGDIVIVEPDMPYQHDDYVLAKKGGNVFIRQICNGGGDWLLKPLNKRYEIKPLGEYRIIGVVRGKQKSYR